MSDLIRALQNPALFPHPTRHFQVIETHISWVILTGEFAYKIKKPMNFGFLDFTTLDKRKAFCEQELRLNQRLAPALYLELVPICGSADAPQLGGDGPVIEYAIRMREFDGADLFDKQQAAGPIPDKRLDEIAATIAQFHRHTPTVPTSNPLGAATSVFAPMAQNFEQIRPMLADPQRLRQLSMIEDWTASTFERLRALIDKRHVDGFVRECHGDLHLGNITLFDGKVVIFDCIEFNDEFRMIDVINDVVFLIMDLEYRGLAANAARVLDGYLTLTGDFDGLNLLTFYKAYRAMVRAKIALFTLQGTAKTAADEAHWLAIYDQYADIAERCADIPNRYLLLTSGVSGSGKSSVSLRLTEALSLIRLRSDVERKRLFGLAPSDISKGRADLYTEAATKQTYARLELLAEKILAAGMPVIVDAAALRAEERQSFQQLAERQCVPFLIVDCDAPTELLRKRIRDRLADGQDPSEADESVLDMQLARREVVTADEADHAIKIHTDETAAVEQLIERIRGHLLPHDMP